MKLSDVIKLQLLKYYRFERSFDYVCTEGIHNSDINAAKENNLIEVEIKISKSDFRREFEPLGSKNGSVWKWNKHKSYKNPSDAGEYYIIPNQFYFCVPAEMVDWAKEYLKDKNPKYGLLAYDTEYTTSGASHTHIKTIKKAAKLHAEAPKERVFGQIVKRMSSELINLKDRYNKDKQELEALQKGIITETKE